MEKRLKLLATKAPPARKDAERTALASAMHAFDHAGEQSRPENAGQTQGSARPGRLTHIANTIWSGLMKQRLMTGSALATLMLVPAAGYIAWHITQQHLPSDVALPVPAELRESGELADHALPLPSDQEQLLAETPAMQPVPQVPFAKRSVAPSQVQSTQAFDSARGRQMLEADGDYAQPPAVSGASQAEPSTIREENRDRVETFATHGVKSVAEDPVSTFSADVDTASYAWVRRALKQGVLPDPRTVRVEELVNYFPYDYAGPASNETPFRATVTVTPTPWNEDTKLLHIGVKGYDVSAAERPRANLVFLIDVSGSMSDADKLPLLKSAFGMLLTKLAPDDTVSIVTYAGQAGTVLEPTAVSERQKILDAMRDLRPGGSTAGAAGIEEAYRLAEAGFVEDGVNRVILATDGDFNVGPHDDDALKALVEAKRDSGVFLSVFGFGQGNYNDQLMQTIAQNGNGVAAYIDTLAEAEKTLVQEATSSLFPIASDVKFQIEFNPAVVAEYRQIGFETRALNREDFNNDRVDAGEIGSGHTVTAIYEFTPVGSPAVMNDDLRYGEQTPRETAGRRDEIAYLKMRAKTPGEAQSKLTEIAVNASDEITTFDAVSDDIRFSIAVAAFGQKLRGADPLAAYGYEAIEKLASGARGEDPYGYRSEFLQLIRLAKGLDR